MKERFKQAQKEQSEKRKNRIRNEDFILGFLPNLITVNSENTHTQTVSIDGARRRLYMSSEVGKD